MAKVIKLTNEEVYIGTNDGQMKKVPRSSIDWDIQVGEHVDLFESADEIIISKRLEKSASSINQYGGNGVYINKIAYILVAIFLGGFGIHKFMVGKVGTGVIMLLLCWTIVPSIIGLVEGLSAIGKKANKHGEIYID